MKIKTLLLSLFFALGMLIHLPAHAQTKSTKYKTLKSYTRKSSSTKKYKSTRPKTVYVKAYTKKNGTRVAAHKRSTPRRK